MMKCAIVIITYNRLECFQRLLKALLNAEYEGEIVDLIISIDKSDNPQIEEQANEFLWQYGRKKVVLHEKRMGLKDHVLSCGSFFDEYDALVILEDDIIIANGFFIYAKQAIREYYSDENIAGISLYSYGFSEVSLLPFEPTKYAESDVYFIQFASSWGQIWLKEQWKAFYRWYEKYKDIDLRTITGLPNAIADWGAKSWKKYHIAYCVQQNKYFVYPYYSLSTNPGDIGEHYRKKNPKFNVPLQKGIRTDYRFEKLTNSTSIKYDAYFERVLNEDEKIENIEAKEITMDLYGQKLCQNISTRYLISSRNLPYKLIKGYDFELRPQEENIIHSKEGQFFTLYDCTQKDYLRKKHEDYNTMYMYYYKCDLLKMPFTVATRNAVVIGYNTLIKNVRRPLGKIKRYILNNFSIAHNE